MYLFQFCSQIVAQVSFPGLTADLTCYFLYGFWQAVTVTVLPGLPSSDTSGPCPVTQPTTLLMLWSSSAPSLPSLVTLLRFCSSQVSVFITGVILRRVSSTKSLSALIKGRIKVSFSHDFGILEKKVVHILNETSNFSNCPTATVFVSSNKAELLHLISRCH